MTGDGAHPLLQFFDAEAIPFHRLRLRKQPVMDRTNHRRLARGDPAACLHGRQVGARHDRAVRKGDRARAIDFLEEVKGVPVLLSMLVLIFKHRKVSMTGSLQIIPLTDAFE